MLSEQFLQEAEVDRIAPHIVSHLHAIFVDPECLVNLKLELAATESILSRPPTTWKEMALLCFRATRG